MKVKNPIRPTDFRPICILPVLSNVFEMILKNHIIIYINENNLLSKYQSGFREKHSCITALLNVVDDLRRNYDDRCPSILVLLDFTKAFDSIDHYLLCSKLYHNYNFSSLSVNLILSYLSNRNQKVYFNGSFSTSLAILLGVPQGSILGPLIFSLFINDLTFVIKYCSFHLYADDLQIYHKSSQTDIQKCINEVTMDLMSIFEWCRINRISINIKKTQCMFLHPNLGDSNIPLINIDGELIRYDSKVRNLGIYLNNSLSWDDHISKMSQRIYQLLRILWMVTDFASIEFRLKMFKAFLLPHFIYGDVVFFGLDEFSKYKIKLLFNACVRYVFRLRKYDHVSPYSSKLLGCSLDTYFNYRVCLQIFTIIKDRQPKYLYEKILFGRSERMLKLTPICSKHKMLNNSFFAKGIMLWNSIPLQIRQSQSTIEFKRKYFEFYNE